ncbi:MAG TPA: cbb3-type cytochrome c oxidase subunit I [Gemmatimonadales bacterium]
MSAPGVTPIDAGGRRAIVTYLTSFLLVLVLMALLGVLMRAVQGGDVPLAPRLFYEVMTAHGISMVGIAGLGGAAVMWYYLRRYVELSNGVLWFNLVCFLLGAVLLLAAIFLGGYATGWTFLYPLPVHSNGQWGNGAAAMYLGGLLLIGVGFLVFYIDVGRAILGRYGLSRALGWPQLFGRSTEEAPPTTVVASTVVTVVNGLALLAGATILVLELVAALAPGFSVDPLIAKNLTYFFGHVFINASIYMSVVGLYEILARETKRPWKSSRPFLIAWNATLLMVLAVYPHHVLMDFVMPRWMLIMGQVLSYTSGFPVLLATAYGTLTIIHRSGIRWTLVSSLLVLSAFAWAAGVIPAILDATIVVNQVMHNTLWVPGHFHFYLVIGQVAMVLAFALDLTRGAAPAPDSGADRLAFWIYAVGGLGLSVVFLYSGHLGIPRRFAVHEQAWMPYARVGALFGVLAVVGMLWFALRFFRRMGAALRGS